MKMLQRGYEFAPGFRLQEYLGCGQFGQVWRASAPGGARTAVKFINLSGGQGEKERQAIERIKQIQHANLMTITAIWLLDEQGKVIDDTPDFSTETRDISELSPMGQSGMVVMPQQEPEMLVVGMLLGGQSLLGRLKDCIGDSHQGIPSRELLSYMEDSAKGLDFLNEPRHDLGAGPVSIQHCDVKPANIVLYGNAAMICDFGLARILTRNQATIQNASGTPAYMAPEAIEGQPSQTSDQYSLAITYYHLRTGNLPIKDGSLFDVLAAHKRGELSFDLVSPDEQKVLRRATHLDWQQRFASNIEFVDHLRDSLRGVSRQSMLDENASNQAIQRCDGNDLLPSSDTHPNRDDPTATFIEPISEFDVKAEGLSPTGPTTESRLQSTGKQGRTLRRFFLSVLALVAIGVFGLATVQYLKSVPKDASLPAIPIAKWSLDSLLHEANSTFDHDPQRASEAFSELLKRKPYLATPEPIQTVKLHRDAVETLLLIDDKNELISTGYDNEPFLWTIQNSKSDPLSEPIRLSSLDRSVEREAIALSADQNSLMAAAGNRIAGWDIDAMRTGRLASTEPLFVITDFIDSVLSLASHPTAPSTIIAGVGDHSIQVFEWAKQPMTSMPVFRFESSDIAGAMKVDPSGEWLLVRGENEGHLVAYAWSDIVASEGANRSPTALPITADGDHARHFAFSVTQLPSRLRVIVGSESGSLTLNEIGEGKSKVLSRVQPHHASIETISVRELEGVAEILIVTCASDGSLCECLLSSQLTIERKRQLSTQPVSCVDLSDDGRWIAAGTWDGHWWLMDRTITENRAAKIPLDSDGGITAESIKIDKTANIVLVGCSDGAIRVWDLKSCQLIAISQLLAEHEITLERNSDPSML